MGFDEQYIEMLDLAKTTNFIRRKILIVKNNDDFFF